MTIQTRSLFQAHPFHLVSPSPWPLNTSFSLLVITFSAVLFFQAFAKSIYLLLLALIAVIYSMSLWFRDVISEGTYLGNHTLAVQRGLNMGVGLFIVSEALFFLAIFWAFFHSALSPTIELGAKWPPMGIEAINPFELPLLNTIILLSSGIPICLRWDSSRVSCRKLSSLWKNSSNKSLELSDTSEVPYLYELPFNSPRIKGIRRIGPHHQDVYSIIFGSLLGDRHMVKEKQGSLWSFIKVLITAPILYGYIVYWSN